MPTTTSIPIIEGLSFGDSAIGMVVATARTAPTDIVYFGEFVTYQLIPDPKRFAIGHSVAVSDATIGSPVRGNGAAATVSDLITIAIAAARSLTTTLVIGDSVSYYMATTRWVNPVVTIPSVSGDLRLTLGGTTVILRKPDFGDSDRYDPFRVNRQSRGGDLQIYRDPLWPATEVLSYKFSYLDPLVAASLLDFLKLSAGAKVTLVDHFGRTWHGFILTPAGSIVQEKRTTLTAAFTFQPVEGPS